MKYRYQVMINIVILALATCFIIYFIEIEKRKDESYLYLTNEELEEIKKRYEQLIKFCEENQKEIGAISEEILSMMEADMPYEEYIGPKNKITNPDWARISKTLKVVYSEDNADKPWLVEYYHSRWRNGYEFEVFYMVEDEEVIDEFLYCRYQKYQYKKINDHLYVCLDNFPYE